MILREKILMIVAVVLIVVPSVRAATTWTMATGYPESSYFTENIRQFVKEVEKRSDGALHIRVYSGDSLIKLQAIKHAVEAGEVQIGEIRLSVYGNEDPVYILGGIPFIAVNAKQEHSLFNAQAKYFTKLFARGHMRILAYESWPGQGFYTNFAIKTPADFKGKKLRVYSTVTEKMGQLLGFNAVIIPFSDVPQAFSTGLINAMYTSPETGIDTQAWDYTKYFMYAAPTGDKNAIIVNERAFRKLAPKIQKILVSAGQHEQEHIKRYTHDLTKKQEKILGQHGMKVTTTPPPIVLNRMRKVSNQLIKQWRTSADSAQIKVLQNYEHSIRQSSAKHGVTEATNSSGGT